MTTSKTRKIGSGLYGTGVTRTAIGSVSWNATTDQVEVVIDKMGGHWYEREMQDDGDLTDYCGNCYGTLTAAKRAIANTNDRKVQP